MPADQIAPGPGLSVDRDVRHRFRRVDSRRLDRGHRSARGTHWRWAPGRPGSARHRWNGRRRTESSASRPAAAAGLSCLLEGSFSTSHRRSGTVRDIRERDCNADRRALRGRADAARPNAERPTPSVHYEAGGTPTYLARGRMSCPVAYCSIAWPTQPTCVRWQTAPAANQRVTRALGPARRG